jgi:hypothetical protein
MKSLRYLIVICTMLAVMRCTENPFGGDKITFGHREITGSVYLHDGGSAEGVYVWLSDFNVGTYTNKSGDFSITLPRESGQGSMGGLSGIYNVYFYLANYYLDSAQVVIRDGEFEYSRANINEDGRLTPSVELERFLRIRTSMEPPHIQAAYTGPIQVSVTLSSTDSVTVILPKSLSGTLGAVLVKRQDREEVSIYAAVQNLNTRIPILIGRSERTVSMNFNTLTSPLVPGDYMVVPYILIAHEWIPEELKESLGSDVEELCPNYLKMPFRREGGYFLVK